MLKATQHPIKNYPELQLGTIIDIIPGMYSYTVVLPSGRCKAVALKNSDCSINGPKNIGVYSLNTPVLCYRPRGSNIAYILAAIPAIGQIDGEGLLDSFSLGTSIGLVQDEPFNYLKNISDKNGILLNAAGRILDTLPGDEGYINSFGVGWLLSKTMLTFKASDIARLDFFYNDDLVRLYSENMEHFTSGGETRVFNYNGQVDEVKLFSPYSWEALGGVNNSDEIIEEDQEFEYTKDTDTWKLEPKDKTKQTGVWRSIELNGYFGDIYRKFIVAPKDFETPETLTSKKPYIGLLDIQHGSDGRFSVKSARGIHLRKTLFIAPPRQECLVDDIRETNYSEAGLASESRRDEPVIINDSPSKRISLNDDLYAWATNYFNQIGLIDSTNEPGKNTADEEVVLWRLPQISEIAELLEITTGESNLYPLGRGTWDYSIPDSFSLELDHRGSIKLYKSTSGIDFMEDGSVVISGGYGEQIIMSGGHVYITCPGDIHRRPGRDDITWAPNDLICRAGGHIDLSSSKKDIRIKAEGNLHALAGNSGLNGGILLESRGIAANNYDEPGSAVSSSGITFKCADNSNIVMQARGIAMSTHANGIISMDANGGRIINVGNSVLDLLENSRISFYGYDVNKDNEFNSTTINIFSRFNTTLGGPLMVAGAIYSMNIKDGERAGLYVDGNCFLYNGQFYSKQSDKVIKFTELPNAKSFAQITAEARDNYETVLDSTQEYSNNTYRSTEDGPFSREYIQSFGFSFRTSEQLNLGDNFEIFETKWQSRFGEDGDTWEETIVLGPEGTKTMAYPGYEKWTEQATFMLRKSDVYYNSETGVPNDWPYDVVTNIEFSDPVKLDGNYRVSYFPE